MSLLTGVYLAKTLSGTRYYRSSITFRNKHISLASYSTEIEAHNAYLLAKDIVTNNKWDLYNYPTECILPYHKWVVLMNLRDNKIYFKNPIYIYKNYFDYFIDQNLILKFDVDDLFYYSNHKIMVRGGYMFVSSYGSQINILTRYGIKNFAIEGIDYRFINGDNTDFRYMNIEVINKYYGVSLKYKKARPYYEARINVNGSIVIGRYSNEIDAAIAYNKAIITLRNKGFEKAYNENFIFEIKEIEYARRYNKIRISKKILDL
ncbi:MAG TPA: hypothetical protein GXZ90_01515 [Clostridiales bacterium]|nr:hypothetical protein [Clostridiales bacterium]